MPSVSTTLLLMAFWAAYLSSPAVLAKDVSRLVIDIVTAPGD
jgi:hypothetical protein